MVELWVILAITSAFLWTIVSLIDKFVLSHEMHNPILATIIAGASTFVLFIAISLILRETIFIPFNLVFLALFTGVVYCFGIRFYYLAIKKGEVSRVVSFLSLIPVFVLIFAFIFLNERLTLLNYFGIILIVFGSFFISLKKDHLKYKFSAAFFVAIISALFFAFRDLFVKYATLQISIWSLLFWIGWGSGLTSLFLFIKYRPHIRKKARKGIKHLILGRSISSISLLIFLIAISMSFVSLVSALAKIQILFTFVAASALTYFHPHFIKEKITPQIILQKSIAIITIVFGAFLII